MKTKRGLSPGVAIILLIAVTVIAVTMIFAFVRPWIQDMLSDKGSCFQTMGEVNLVAEIGSVESCYDEENGEAVVIVKRGSSDAFELKGFVIALDLEGESKSFEIIDGQNNSEIKKYNGEYGEQLSIPGRGEAITYVIKSVLASKARIAPILKSGVTCSETDDIELILC